MRETQGYAKQGAGYGYNKVKGLNALLGIVPGTRSCPGFLVLTPLLFFTTLHRRFASARLPDPHLTRSLPRLFRIAHHDQHLTGAAYGGLKPPPVGRFRRTYLHRLHSTHSEDLYMTISFIVRGT